MRNPLPAPGMVAAVMMPLYGLRRLWLVKSSAIFVGLGLMRGISQFAFVLAMTRLLLPADYGLYSNFLYITSILSPVFFLKSDVPVARYYAAHPNNVADYIGAIVILCSVLTSVSTVVLWLSRSVVLSVTGIPGAWQMLLLVTCWTYGLFLIVLAVLQIELRAWAMSLSRIIPLMTCEIAAMGAVFALGGGWRTALATYTAVSAVWGIAFTSWLRGNGYMRFNISWANMRDFLHVSIPLIPMSIGFMSVQISAQFVLTHYFGPAEVGIYAAANQFSMGIWLLALSSQQAFLPWLFKTLNKKNAAEDYKVVGAVIGIIGILGVSTIAYVIIFKFIFPLVIGKTFTRGNLLLGQLAWANFFLGVQMTMNCFLYHRKLTVTSAAVTSIAAALGLALGIWRIPLGGALTAAYVTEISAFLTALFTTVVVLWEFAPVFRNGFRDGSARLLYPGRARA